MRECKPTAATRILDIGVSDEEGPESNMLEQCYPWRSQIVCAGLGDGRELLAEISWSFVRQNRGGQAPCHLATRSLMSCSQTLFWSMSAAGWSAPNSFEKRRRVGRTIFFVVPNRWFPVEHHTALPILHWNAGLFRLVTRKGRLSFWSDPKNMDFLSARIIKARIPIRAFRSHRPALG